MRKPDFCLCKNKGADQLLSIRKADQRLCFHYMDSTILLLSKSENFKLLVFFCDYTVRFMLDLVENPEDQFSHVAAHIFFATLCDHS